MDSENRNDSITWFLVGAFIFGLRPVISAVFVGQLAIWWAKHKLVDANLRQLDWLRQTALEAYQDGTDSARATVIEIDNRDDELFQQVADHIVDRLRHIKVIAIAITLLVVQR